MPNYLANTNTKEIHRLSTVNKNCEIDKINPEHKLFLDYEFKVDSLIRNEGYNGCYWCYKEKHTD